MLTGERAGRPLSRDSQKQRGADVVGYTEGEMGGSVIASPPLDPAWS